jgi:hypothetical protein
MGFSLEDVPMDDTTHDQAPEAAHDGPQPEYLPAPEAAPKPAAHDDTPQPATDADYNRALAADKPYLESSTGPAPPPMWPSVCPVSSLAQLGGVGVGVYETPDATHTYLYEDGTTATGGYDLPITSPAGAKLVSVDGLASATGEWSIVNGHVVWMGVNVAPALEATPDPNPTSKAGDEPPDPPSLNKDHQAVVDYFHRVLRWAGIEGLPHPDDGKVAMMVDKAA